MNFCPNLKNKQINAEFNELANVLGEDLAYLLWDKTSGLGVIFDEHGKHTKKFKQVLENANGNKELAILAIAETIINGTPDTELKTGIYLDYYTSQRSFIDGFKPVVHISQNLKRSLYNRKNVSDIPQNVFVNVFGEDISELFSPFMDLLLQLTDDDRVAEIRRILDEQFFGDFLPRRMNEISRSFKERRLGMGTIYANNLIYTVRNHDEWESLLSYDDVKFIKYTIEKIYKGDRDLFLTEIERNSELVAQNMINLKKEQDKYYFGLRSHYTKLLRLYLEHLTNPELNNTIMDKISSEINLGIKHHTETVEKRISSRFQEKKLMSFVNGSNTKTTHTEILGLIKLVYPEYSWLCDKLSSIKGTLDIFFVGNNRFLKRPLAKYTTSGIVQKTQFVTIYSDVNQDQNKLVHSILHEIVHAATIDYLDRHIGDRVVIKKFIDKLKEQYGDNSMHAFKDEYEFIAEFFSNPELQELLKNTKPLQDIFEYDSFLGNLKNCIYNAFEWFKHLILKAVGADENEISTMYEQLSGYMNYILSIGAAASESKATTVEERYNLYFGGEENGLSKSYELRDARDSGILFDTTKTVTIYDQDKIQKTIDQLSRKLQRKLVESEEYRQLSNNIFELQLTLKGVSFAEQSYNLLKTYEQLLDLIYNELKLGLANGYLNITPTFLVNVHENVLSVIKTLLLNNDIKNAVGFISDDAGKIIYNGVLNSVYNLVRDVDSEWKSAVVVVAKRVADRIIDETSTSDLDKEGMKKVFYDWMLNNFWHNDMSSATSFLYNYSNASNPVIKAMFHQISLSDSRVYEEAVKILAELKNIKNGLSRSKIKLEDLIEKDISGKPTGYFTSSINRGAYEEILKERVKELNEYFWKKYGFSYNIINGEWHISKKIQNLGTSCLVDYKKEELSSPSDFGDEWVYIRRNGEIVSNTPPFVEYLREIEYIKSNLSERRYLPYYYLERLSEPYDEHFNPYGHGLSPQTLIKYQHIQANINYYLDNATGEDGICRPETLTDELKALLQYWKNLLHELSNPYEEIINVDGIDYVVKKEGDEYKMAMEILAWERFINQKINTEYDMNAFNDALYEALKKGPAAESEFLKYNGVFKINPLYYDYVNKQVAHAIASDPRVSTSEDEIYQILKNRHKHVEDDFLKSLATFCDISQSDINTLRERTFDIQYFVDLRERLLEKDAISTVSKIDGIGIGGFYKDFFGKEPYLYVDKDEEYGIFGDDIDGIPIIDTIYDSNDNMKPHCTGVCSYATFIMVQMTNAICDMANNPDMKQRLDLLTINGNQVEIITEALQQYPGKSLRYAVYNWLYHNVFTIPGYNNNVQLLSVFTKTIPLLDNFHTGWGSQPSMCYVPTTSRFNKKTNKDDSDPIFNPYFDTTSLEKTLPNVMIFRNPAYDKLEDNYWYNQLIGLMKGAWKIYFPNCPYDYRLPQIEATFGQTLSRIFQRGALLTFGDALSSLFAAQERDNLIRRQENPSRNPDGSVFSEASPKYVRMLEDPTIISKNPIETVALFCEAALHYADKNKITDDLKIIRYAMDRVVREDNYNKTRTPSSPPLGENKNSTNMYDTMIKTQVGGIDVETNDSKDMGGDEYKGVSAAASGIATALGFNYISLPPVILAHCICNIPFNTIASATLATGVGLGAIAAYKLYTQQLMGNIANSRKIQNWCISITAMMMLGYNIVSSTVGFLDSLTNFIRESLLNYGTNFKNAAKSFGRLIKDIPQLIWNIGAIAPNCKTGWLMARNNLTVSFEERSKRSGNYRLWRLIKMSPMGLFTMGDYLTTALLMHSKYSNIKLIKKDMYPSLMNSNIKEGFYDKISAIEMLQNAGFSKQEAKLIYKSSSVDLYNATNCYGDLLPEYEQYKENSKEMLSRPFTATHYSAALQNGMVQDNDRAPWKTSSIAQVVFILRGFMLTNFQHSFAGSNDNIPRQVTTKQEDVASRMGTLRQNKYILENMTPEEKSRRFSYNYEYGGHQSETLKAIGRGVSGIVANLVNIIKGNGGKNRRLSLTETLAFKRLFIWASIILLYGFSLNRLATYNDENVVIPRTSVKRKAGLVNPRSLINPLSYLEYYDTAIENKHYLKFSEFCLYRTINSLIGSMTQLDAQSLLQNVTACLSVYERILLMLQIWDKYNTPGKHEETMADELQKTDAYVGHPWGEKQAFKMVGPLDNFYRSTTLSGIEKGLEYARKTASAFAGLSAESFMPDEKETSTIRRKHNSSSRRDSSGRGSGRGDSGRSNSGRGASGR